MRAFKYIFAIIVAGLIGFAIYTIYMQNQESNNNENEVTDVIEKQVITTLRLGISKFDTMNPLLSTNKSVQYIDKLVFEPLLYVNEDYSLTNCLAKEYSKIGDTTYLVKLRDDITWHDGTKFVAKDVQFTIDKFRRDGIPSIYQENVKNISGIDIIDDYTLRINLNTEVPFFEYNLIFPILPYHYYLDEDFINSERIPIGTGMYKIINIDDTVIELRKNEEWWDKEKNPRIDNIKINLYTSMGELYNAFKIGNVDLIPTSNMNFTQYVGTIGFETTEFVSREYDFLAFNTSNSVLQKTEVRQAIAMAIDKANIVATIFNNNYYISNYPLDYGNYLYSNEVGTIEYNPENAQKLLEDNEWSLQYRTWSKVENYRTLRTSFTLVVNESNAERVAVAEAIKNQLENIGIEIIVRAVPDSQYNSYLNNKNYDMIIAGTNISTSPDLELYFGNDNLANYFNEKASKIITSLRSINDKNMLKDYYKELQQIYQEEVPYISLYRNREFLLHSLTLIGEKRPTWFNIFYNFENWYRQN